ncbi:exonuclease III [Pseudoalteromonas rubra]|uniref:Exonuclease III n=1 Tax=Pseudoalteromonas rubra TaxID=43658 RepID=A0A5S3WMI9_9GAMM|nr:exonuclease III [Pseudoalteromonas rubra]TMP29063.1 exonuclease III [Pseudoalteromonas rubra]TMP33572.1 exonuclease III [Pseudoalteromonas rubra]
MFKSLSLVTLISIASFSAIAAPVVSGNASPESKVCAIAAEQGLSAARAYGAKHGVFVSRFSKTLECNGEDIRSFAKQAQAESANTEAKVKLVAKNSTVATELCLKAAKEGLSSLSKLRHQTRNLKCNDLPVKQFIKNINNTAI